MLQVLMLIVARSTFNGTVLDVCKFNTFFSRWFAKIGNFGRYVAPDLGSECDMLPKVSVGCGNVGWMMGIKLLPLCLNPWNAGHFADPKIPGEVKVTGPNPGDPSAHHPWSQMWSPVGPHRQGGRAMASIQRWWSIWYIQQQEKPWQYHHYVHQGRTLQICRKSPQAGTREGESAQCRALGTGIRHLQRAEPCVEVEPIWRNKTVRGAENLQIYEMYLANAFYNSRVFSFPDLLIRESCRPFQCRALLRSLHRCNQPGRWQIISGREPKDLKIYWVFSGWILRFQCSDCPDTSWFWTCTIWSRRCATCWQWWFHIGFLHQGLPMPPTHSTITMIIYDYMM